MTPTPEQKKVVGKCKAMLKRAFPEMDGKCIFKLNPRRLSPNNVDFSIVLFNINCDVDESREVTEVVL